jgi:hypothetical protein
VKLGILREEHRLRVFKMVLRRIFGLLREEVVGGLKRLHNEELHNLYASSNIIRLIKSRTIWVGNLACMGETRNVYSILVGKLEGNGH